MSEQRPILIAGPTASGKSGLAVRLAERYGGTVINADSVQVYRDLRILTARCDAQDEARAPHALFGFVDGADRYSAGRYIADAYQALSRARGEGRRPIFVGGTGLYLKALLDGLSPIPPVPEDIRRHWRAEAATSGSAALHEILSERDPEMAARLARSDPQRLVRALEVLDATGISLAEWQRVPGEPVLKQSEAVCLVISPDRAELHRRIDARFAAMMAQGALDEVRALEALQLDPSLPVMSALGVRPLLQHLRGQVSLEEATGQAQAETRQYAKRQQTWARSNMITWQWQSAQEVESLEAAAIAFIDR